ncbi:hypothetical protein HDU76_006716 [Blyttiomyces sp. JEL0837]|nr:hypothetical protein HDU76_006716 [Blyttiomyces sp. JEL0837]
MFFICEEFARLGFCIIGLVCLVFFGGPILIAIGITYLVAAGNHDRENRLSAYNSRVDLWTNQYSQTFAASSFQFTTVDPASPSAPTNTSYTIGLWLTGSASNVGFNGVQDGNKDGYKQYPAFKFEGNPVWVSGGKGYVLTAVNAKGIKTTVTITNLPAVAQATYTKSDMNCISPGDCDYYSYGSSSYINCLSKPYCYETCNSYYGTYSSGVCYFPAVLDSICFRVADTDSGYKLDTNSNISTSPGCDYNTKFSPGIYVPLQKSDWFATFKSSMDPFIYLAVNTGGSYAFGASTAQNAGTGVGLLIAGIIFWALVVLAIYLCARHQRNQRNQTYTDTEVYVVQQPQVVYIQQQPQKVYLQQQQPQQYYYAQSPQSPVPPYSPPPAQQVAPQQQQYYGAPASPQQPQYYPAPASGVGPAPAYSRHPSAEPPGAIQGQVYQPPPPPAQ